MNKNAFYKIMYQKNIILFAVFILCLNSCIPVKKKSLKETDLKETKSENTMKYPGEVRKLFNGLPVDLGIEKVLEESNLLFEYAKTIRMLGYSEVWFTELDAFTYFSTKADKIRLSMGQDFHELDIDSGDGGGGYNATLRFFYANEDVMKQEFDREIYRIFDIGEIREYDDYESIEGMTEVGLIQDKETPNIVIAKNIASEFSEPEIVIVYRNCLN